MNSIRKVMSDTGWFAETGSYVLFDGQFGSTGKGLLASVIAEAMGDRIDMVTTNAGPNSGHTAYYGGRKVMTQQIPVASAMLSLRNIKHTCYLNGGAILDPDKVREEMVAFGNAATTEYVVHPAAAIIKPEHLGELSTIASTGKGVGPALMSKLGRNVDNVVAGHPGLFPGWTVARMAGVHGRVFVETAQGWSLGINSGFYPYTTSRECSVSQALADFGVSPRALKKSIASLRTYPIRVGNTTDGWSGPCYPDQVETTFEEIGQAPELTTVTKRVRRIFTWSWDQFDAMLRANHPDALFINFIQYLKEDRRADFLRAVEARYWDVMRRVPDFILVGRGPNNENVSVYNPGQCHG